MHPDVIVVGSANVDFLIHSSALPAPGETVLGDNYRLSPGGKGANQAVAACALGANVAFVAAVGTDGDGDWLLRRLEERNVDTARVMRHPNANSGSAFVAVDPAGENQIIVIPGANGTLSAAHVQQCFAETSRGLDVQRATPVVLVSLEIPLQAARAACEIGSAQGWKVVLNPAPATSFDPVLLEHVDVVTPNRAELEKAFGIELPPASQFQHLEVASQSLPSVDVVATLGPDGAAFARKGAWHLMPAPRVEPVDTTGAGDAFNGALAVALSRGQSIESAIRFALVAGSIATTVSGAWLPVDAVPHYRPWSLTEEGSTP